MLHPRGAGLARLASQYSLGPTRFLDVHVTQATVLAVLFRISGTTRQAAKASFSAVSVGACVIADGRHAGACKAVVCTPAVRLALLSETGRGGGQRVLHPVRAKKLGAAPAGEAAVDKHCVSL